MSSAILTESLTKRYGRRPGIESLDLEIQPGEVFGFIGPNGAGKTTTIRLLLDLLHPEQWVRADPWGCTRTATASRCAALSAICPASSDSSHA